MSRVENIITRVRDTLGDSDGTRWTVTSLIRRLNEGQYDIAKKAELFKKTVALTLVKGQYIYTLPEDFIKLKDALFAQQPLDVYMAQQMERIYGADWRLHTTTGKPTVVVTDRQDSRTLRVYPRPFTEDLYDRYIGDPDMFGITDALTGYTVDNAFGTTGSIYDTELVDATIEPFGIIVDGIEGDYLAIEYVRRPQAIVSVTEDPEIPDAFDTALVRYISGTALRDDIDAQNRAMGNEELTLYQNELMDLKAVGKQANTTVAHNNTSEYRGMG